LTTQSCINSNMKTLIVLFLIFISLFANAYNFHGQIFDSKSQQPMAYVNVGIIGKGIGTVSDENGNFSLSIDDKYTNDTLKITSIGYLPIKYCVRDAMAKYGNSPAKIYLEESSYALTEVIIRPIKYSTKVVGNTNSGSPCVYFIGRDTAVKYDGCEIGTLIKLKNKPAFIDKINFSICSNDFDSLTLRLNIYSKNNENILKHPIYVTIKKGQKEVTINTKPYNIKVEDDFIIAFEALQILQSKKGKAGSKKFSFSGGFSGSDMMTRMNIYDKWAKTKAVVIGFNATITYQDTEKGNWFKRLFK
jgi:hypothetical protein